MSELRPRKITAVGKSGSGKTLFLFRHFVTPLPRVLVVDRTGEWPRKLPDAPRAIGFDATMRMLQALAPQSHWKAIAYLETPDVVRLMHVLVPLGMATDSPCQAVGGMAILLDEIHTHMTAQSAGPLLTPYRMGRHAGLTILAADQSPSLVNKEVFRGADVVALFRVTTRNDINYMLEEMPGDDGDRAVEWARSAPYRYALWFPDTETLELREPDQWPTP